MLRAALTSMSRSCRGLAASSVLVLLSTACATESARATCDTEESCAQSDALRATDIPFTLAPVKAAKYPVLLHHGFNASTTNDWSFYQVKEALEQDGQFVVVTEVQPFAGVKKRAETLKPQVDSAIAAFCKARQPGDTWCTSETKVNIVAHSMGGLDARYLISSLGYGSRVASLTTLSTPHGGTSVADVGLGVVPDGESWKTRALDSLLTWYGKKITDEALAADPDLVGALNALASKNMPAFDMANPDDARVQYQSWAGVSRAIGGPRLQAAQDELRTLCEGKYFGALRRADFMVADLIPMSEIVGHFGSEFQDGMVTVASAKHGKFMGCIPADHMQEVGQRRKVQSDRYTGFDHLVFLRNIVADLARQGF